MNVSFGPQSGASAAPALVTEKVVTPTPVEGVTVESVTTVCPAAAAPAALVPPVQTSTALAPVGLVLGDKIPEFKEIILPRINIVQNIGGLKDTFEPGELVFNQTTVVFTPPILNKTTGQVEKAGTPPIDMVILGFKPTRFVEKVAGGGRGLIVDSEAKVTANGGTLDFNEAKLRAKDGMKYFEALAEALVAIRRPEHCKDDDTVFVYEVAPGEKYALGIWGMKGSAYTVAKTAFFTPRSMGCLKKGGYPSYHFAVSTKEKGFQTGNKAWVPVAIPTVPTSETFLAFARQILTGN
jgi:hypothetical protein